MADDTLPAGAGAEAFQTRLDGGQTLQDTMAWKTDLRNKMLLGGMNPKTVDSYWGDEPPDHSAIDALARENVAKADPVAVAKSPMEALAAGWNMSVPSLQAHAPLIKAGPNMPWYDDMLWMVGRAAGDAPYAILGGLMGFAAGGAMGSAAPVVGTALGATLGAGFGSAALPAAMRASLLDHYENGAVKSASDFALRASGIALASAKDGLAGAMTSGVMGPATSGAAAVGMPKWAAGLSGMATAATAGTTTSAVLERRMPTMADWVLGPIAILGFHAAGMTVGATGRFVFTPAGQQVKINLGKIYENTGMPPATAAAIAEQNVAVKSETLAPTTAAGEPATPILKSMAPPEAPPYENPAQPKAVEGAEAPAKIEPMPTEARPPVPPQLAVDNALRMQGAKIEPTEEQVEQVEPPSPVEPSEPGQPKTLSELQASIDSQIFKASPQPGVLIRNLNKFRSAVAMFQGGYTPGIEFDKRTKGLAFADTTDGSIPAHRTGDANLEDLLRFMSAAPDQASQFVNDHTLALEDGKAVVSSQDSLMKGYAQLTPGPDNLANFTRWRMAMSTIERAGRGVETGTDLQDAMDFVSHPEIKARIGEYEKANAIIQNTKNAALQWMVDAGKISPEQRDAMIAANQYHVNWHRVLDPDGYKAPVVNAKDLAKRGNIRVAKGGSAQIIDPAISDVQNLHLMIAEGNKNLASGLVRRLALAAKEAGVEDEIGVSKKEDITPDVEEELKNLKDENGNPIPIEAARAFAPLIAERKYGGRAGPNDMLHWENGKMEVWTIKDAHLADLLRGPSLLKPDVITDLAIQVAGWQRSGITGRPSFLLRAVSHGQFGAATTAPGVYMAPYQDLMVGIMDRVFNAGKGMEAARANGAFASDITALDYVKSIEDTQKVWDQTGTTNAIWNTVRHPLEAMHLLSQRTTALATTGRFIANVNAGTDPMRAASFAARAHLDFREQQGLSWVRTMTRAVSFMATGFKDIEQFGRAMQERPVTTILRGAAHITAASTILYAINYEQDKYLPADQQYREIPQIYRDLFFISPQIMGHRIFWPKPYVLGVFFGSNVEHALRWWADNDPKEFADWGKLMHEQFIPPLVAAVAQPFVEDWANKRLLDDRPIIANGLEKQTAWAQYGQDTTEGAKALARVLGPPGANLVDMSPSMLENWVGAWGGPMPLAALRVLEQPFHPVGRPWEASDFPFFGAFLARHSYGLSSQSVQDFFEDSQPFINAYNTLTAAMHAEGTQAQMDGREPSWTTDIRAAADSLGLKYDRVNGDPTDLGNDPKMQEIEQLQGVQTAFHRAAAVLRGINNSTMSSDEKRKYSDAISANMVSAADAANRMLKAIKENNPEAFQGAADVGAALVNRAGMEAPQ